MPEHSLGRQRTTVQTSTRRSRVPRLSADANPIAFFDSPRSLLALQRAAGNQTVRRLLQGPNRSINTAPPTSRSDGVIQRDEPAAPLAVLNQMLDRFNVPERQVIDHLATLSPADKATVCSNDSYRVKLNAALDAIEMALAVDAVEAPLPVTLDWMLTQTTTYALLRPRIMSATAAERAALLADGTRLTALRNALRWHDFAKAVELLGRSAPDRATLLADPAVQGELEAAWTRSNPGVRVIPARGPLIHEEGGAIYLNLITNAMSFQLWSGGPADFSDRMPPAVDDSIVVATFHTHPQLGEDFKRTPSPGDISTGAGNGVPGIIRTEEAGRPVYYEYGPDVRLHLAGSAILRSWSYPGPAGGEAP